MSDRWPPIAGQRAALVLAALARKWALRFAKLSFAKLSFAKAMAIGEARQRRH